MANKLQRFWFELRRRKTVQTAVAYLIFSAAAVGFASDTLGGLDAPAWILRTIIFGLFALFPVVLVVSWIFDFTWHGFERTEDSEDTPDNEPDVEQESSDDPETPEPAYLEIETGSSHKHQISILRTTISLTEQETNIDDPERLLSFLGDIESIVQDIAEKYSATLINHDSNSYEYLFGYPTAYENDAIRAAVMGLAIQEDLNQFNKEHLSTTSQRLAAVTAIHSDLVVINREESEDNRITIVGKALQEANWLQSLAPVDCVVLDSFSHQLLRNQLVCEPIGEFQNNQTQSKTRLFKAIESRQSDLEAVAYDDIDSVFLGRDAEVDLIMSRWQQALEGEDEYIILKGEAGIGKSKIVREVVNRIQSNDSAAVTVMPLFCSPLEQNTAFQPIIEYLMGPGLGLRRTQSATKRTERIRRVLNDLEIDIDRAVPLVASLLSLDTSQAAAFSESARQELITYLLEMIRATAKRRSLLLIFEDLHWADPSTLELLSMLIIDGSDHGMLCLFTTRPGLEVPWASRSNVETLSLSALSKNSTKELVAHFLRDTSLPDEFVRRLVKEAGGNPLFAEELAKAIYETAKSDSQKATSDLVLPGTLQRSLAARIDNLGAAKPLVQLCSLLGREFNYPLLLSVSNTNDETALRQQLETLVNAEFLYQHGAVPDSRYTFKHILMQETAYQSMLQATRRDLHSQVVKVLESEPAYQGTMPEVMAYHYEGCEQFNNALQTWVTAANKASSNFANAEAIELCNNALRVIGRLPDSPKRDMTEIQIQAIKGRAQLTTYGYAEPQVEKSFIRALELCDRVGDVPQLFVLLVGLWSYFQIGGSVENAANVATRLMRLADSDNSAAKKVQAHYCSGYTAYRGGKFIEALELLEQAQEIANSNDEDYTAFSPSGDDGRIHNLAILSHIHWQLGNLEAAEKTSTQAVELANKLENPVGQVFAMFLRTWLMHMDRDFEQAIEWGEKTAALAKEKQLNFWIANSLYISLWARFHQQRDADGKGPEELLEKMLTFVARAREVGGRFGTIGMFLETAESLACNRRTDEAEALLDEAGQLIDELGENYLYCDQFRVRAEIARYTDRMQDAIELFQQAIKTSEDQQALSLRLRAAHQLAEVFREQGEEAAATQVVVECALPA